ncbi:putative glycosyltransferase [subsurface metagenome]
MTKATSPNDSSMPRITLAIPEYNEEANLPEVYQRVTAVIDSLPDYEFEILLIDNCSQDATERLSREFIARDNRWRYLRFSRDFGPEASLAAGTYYATGDALIFLPSDLQEPIELIPTMIEKWQEGYDMVYGTVSSRKDESFLMTLGAKLAYRLIYWLSDIKIPPNATFFRLISRRVIEAVLRCDEQNRYFCGLVHWVGFRQCALPYKRAPRVHGESYSSPLFLVGHALNALTAFSVRPLQLASIVGILAMGLSAAGALIYLTLVILVHFGMLDMVPPPPGWTTIVLLILFFGGFQFLFLGILGKYLSHVYKEVKQRPLWVVQSTSGFPPEQDPLKSIHRFSQHGS